MTERERLIELLNESTDKNGIYLDKIADYLLENGVVLPPFKVGEMVYRICKRVDGRKNGYIRSVEITPHNFDFSEICLKKGIYFLTRKEAEKALAENEEI